MSTKRALIAEAFEELGLAGYIFDATPEELQSALKRMDRIAAQWLAQTIDIGYIAANGLDAESGVTSGNENCLALHLAVAMAPSFGKAVSQDTKNAASAAWNAMYVSLGRRPQVVMPASMPYGTGNKGGVLGSQYFPESDGTVTGL